MTPDLRITIAGVEFDNPIMTASGCCGYGEELAAMYPLSKLGGLVTKTITPLPRMGHPAPRTAETSAGMLNAIGLANVGIDKFITDKIPFLEKQKTKIIVNVGGATVQEYVNLCAQLAPFEIVHMVELNLGCPNVNEGGMEFGSSAKMTEKTVAECKLAFPRPIMAKLTPNVTSISEIAKAAEQGGADCLSIINSLVGTTVDINTWRPTLTYNRGGLTGPAVKPIALAMVDAVYRNVKIPIIGIGGIANASDVIEFLLFGASAVQVGTQLFVEPDAPIKIVDDLKTYMKQRKLSALSDLIGKVQRY